MCSGQNIRCILCMYKTPGRFAHYCELRLSFEVKAKEGYNIALMYLGNKKNERMRGEGGSAKRFRPSRAEVRVTKLRRSFLWRGIDRGCFKGLRPTASLQTKPKARVCRVDVVTVLNLTSPETGA